MIVDRTADSRCAPEAKAKAPTTYDMLQTQVPLPTTDLSHVCNTKSKTTSATPATLQGTRSHVALPGILPCLDSSSRY